MGDLLQRAVKLSKIVRVAPRALMDHKLRSTLSIVGVVCGVMAVLSMISIGEGARIEALRQIEQLGTRNVYLKAVDLTEGQAYRAGIRYSPGLSLEDVDRLKNISPAVAAVSGLRVFSTAIIGAGRQVTPQFIACIPNLAALQNLSVHSGRFIRARDIRQRQKVCVLGSSVCMNLGPGSWLGSHLRIDDHLFKIVGILQPYDAERRKSAVVSLRNYNDMVFVPLGVDPIIARPPAGRGKNVHDDGLSEIIVQIDRTAHVVDAAAVIQRAMDIAHQGVNDFQMVIPQELLKQSQKSRRMFTVILGAIAGISILVGGIGIMNIMLATVSERTREIGIRRAVGATRGHILLQFLAESAMLTFSGGVVGVFAGIGVSWLISIIAGWPTVVSLPAVAVPLIVSMLTGICFGLYPAYRAALMNPIDALRHG